MRRAERAGPPINCNLLRSWPDPPGGDVLIHFPYSEPNSYFLLVCDEQRKESFLCDTCCAIVLFLFIRCFSL